MSPCSVRLCGKNSSHHNFKKDGITFHRFPSNPHFKNIWIEITKRENWFPTKNSTICSEHFTKDCFTQKKNRRSLLTSAVPTLNLPLQYNSVESQSVMPYVTTCSLKNIQDCGIKLITPGQLIKSETSSDALEYIPPRPLECQSITEKHLHRKVNDLSYKLMQKNKLIRNLRGRAEYMRKKMVVLKNILEHKNRIIASHCTDISKISKCNGKVSKKIFKKPIKKEAAKITTELNDDNGFTGNCVPFEQVSIVSCSPTMSTINIKLESENSNPLQ